MAEAATEGTVAFGFWVRRLVREHVADADLFLGVLDPVQDLDITAARSMLAFRRSLVPLQRDEALVFGVASGIRIGDRDRLGSFYRLTYRDGDGAWQRVYDPMASTPAEPDQLQPGGADLPARPTLAAW